MWFFFPSLVVPPDPSLTICLTCLIIGNIVKIMGGGQMTTNYLTQRDLGGGGDGLGRLIGDSFQFLLKRICVSSFVVTIGTTVIDTADSLSYVILGSREIPWRGQSCWCRLLNLHWLAKKAGSVKPKLCLLLAALVDQILRESAASWFRSGSPGGQIVLCIPHTITKESSVHSGVISMCVWAYILIMCI